MPRRGGRQNGRVDDEVDSQPLLVSSREDLLSTRASPSPSASSSTDNVLFAIDDDDDYNDGNDGQETSALDGPPHPSRRGKADQAVRFQEHIQVIAPPLRSTLESREAGTSSRALRLALVIDEGDPTWRFLSAFDLDSDELDHDGVGQANLERGAQRSREQSMPLLVGLLDASTVRRSLDIPLGVDGESTYSDIDLEELAAKQAGGGGMLNSIANMANSILGAGVWPAHLPIALIDGSPRSRDHWCVIRSCFPYSLEDLNTSSGLPYAVSRAGFFTGIFLLVVLCGVTDWTIRLIVTNAKLSGTNSYIGVMNRCFGSSGRAAVSFFQFSFAFGGASMKPHDSLHATFYSFIHGQECAPLGSSSVRVHCVRSSSASLTRGSFRHRGHDPTRHPLRIS